MSRPPGSRVPTPGVWVAWPGRKTSFPRAAGCVTTGAGLRGDNVTRTDSAAITKTITTAIIGAGMAGLACARALADAGASVTLFDKGRGIGGRIATRRGAQGSFDHGAVALSADAVPGQPPLPDSYAAYLATAEGEGAAAFWPAAQGWVGLPGMSGLLRPMARGLTVQVGAEVTGVQHAPQGWCLSGAGLPETVFDRVILAIPQPQAMVLLAGCPALQAAISGAAMRPVWTAMVRFAAPLPLDGDLILRSGGPVAMSVRTSAKPGRDPGDEAWVIHAAADWTAAHLERDKPEAAALLLAAFLDDVGLPGVPALMLEGHRWRYGLTDRALGQAFVHDAALGLAVCGDWCLGATAEDAFASGCALAKALLADQ